MSDNPDYPDADVTAPGGMSQKALVKELVADHGYNKVSAEQMSWPEMIRAVANGRLVAEVREHGVGVLEPDDADDLDDLLAEFEGESVSVIEEVVHDVKAGLFIGMPGTKDYIFDGHRGAGPSGAERWMTCTASLGAARAFLETLTPNQQEQFAGGSTAARQGTTAHAVAEVQAHVLMGDITPEEGEATLLELAIMPETEGEAYDETMEEYVSEYVALVQQYVDEGREVFIEQRVTACIPLLTATDGEQDTYDITGSADLSVMPTPEEPVLVVGDLKYGEGIDVDPDSNPQIRIYALGVLAKVVEVFGGLPDWLTDVEYLIVQPRLGGIKAWTETVDDLLDWQDTVLSVALTEALGGAKAGAKFVPGKVQCQWCPARGACPALTEQRMDEASELFDVIVSAEFEDGPGAFPETESLTDEQLGSLYSQIKGLTDIIGDLKEEAQRRLHRGRAIPGFVLVNYTPPRKWAEGAQDLIASGGIEELTSQQADILFKEPVLVTPTQAIKLLGEDADKIEPLVIVPDKRPVIAPEGDRRKVWEGKPPEAMFEDES